MLGPKVVEHKASRVISDNPAPVLSFADFDENKDGHIQPSEYYGVAKEVNTKSPMQGLLFILGAVIACTLSASYLLRPKK
jgi:hypothetical protein